MARRPKVSDQVEIPAKVFAIMKRRALEVVRCIGHRPDTTLADIAMSGYLQGLDDMQRAIFNNPHVLRAEPTSSGEDWQLP